MKTLPRGRLVARAAAGLALALAAGSTFAQFIPSETPATSNRRLLDPEFNKGKNLMTWVDMIDGSIWVGGIDRATGAFVPEDGRGSLVEKNAAPYGGLGFTLNGPEWVLGSTDYIVYTRFVDRTNPTPANAQLGAAFQNANGRWAVRTISADRRLNAPYGSENPREARPRITYNDEFGNHFWRVIDAPETEEAVPLLTTPNLLPAVRHVRTGLDKALVYPAPIAGVPQVVIYNVETKQVEQVSFDTAPKDQPWAWRAPDFGNDLVALATVDKTRLVLYRKSAQTGAWSEVYGVDSPLGGRFFSTEPFVYGGKSYVLVQILVGEVPTSIWLMNFDAAAPIVRRLTPELPDRARADPEIFFTDGGPIVYFSRFDQSKGPYWLCVPCAEGLYRAPTGIPFASGGSGPR